MKRSQKKDAAAAFLREARKEWNLSTPEQKKKMLQLIRHKGRQTLSGQRMKRARKSPAGRPLTPAAKHCIIVGYFRAHDALSYFDGRALQDNHAKAALYPSSLVAQQAARTLKRPKGVTYIIAPASWTPEHLRGEIAGTRENPIDTKQLPPISTAEVERLRADGHVAYIYPRKRMVVVDGFKKYRLTGKLPTKLNPASRAEIARAAKGLRRFSGHAVKKVRTYKRPTGGVGFELGPISDITYIATRDGETAKYHHPFKAKSRPSLVASSDGTALEIVGGRFRVTARGIVDL